MTIKLPLQRYAFTVDGWEQTDDMSGHCSYVRGTSVSKLEAAYAGLQKNFSNKRDLALEASCAELKNDYDDLQGCYEDREKDLAQEKLNYADLQAKCAELERTNQAIHSGWRKLHADSAEGCFARDW